MKFIAEKIRKKMVQAICDFDMLAEGDNILVAVSGGKDSTILALLLKEVQKKSKIKFDFSAVILDQKQPGFNPVTYKSWLENKGIPLTIISEDTYSIVKEKVASKKSYCGLCSRLRRGILYNYAEEKGFTKIALGHHRDDINETALLNMFYSGCLSSMPPKFQSDDKRNIVIRPLSYVPETELTNYANRLEIPVIPCNLCGSQEQLKRKKIKNLLKDLESDNPRIGSSIIAALSNVKTTHLLDRSLNDFAKI